MELSEYIETLRGEVASVTRVAGEDVARAGQMIAEALDSSIRLTLLDVLSGAAAEITSRLDNTEIELRLSSGSPTFVVVHAPQDLTGATAAASRGRAGARGRGRHRDVTGDAAPAGRAEVPGRRGGCR